MIMSASVAFAGPRGQCNSALAQNLGLINQLAAGVHDDPFAVCWNELIPGMTEFLANPTCLGLLVDGDLFPKDNNLRDRACSVLENSCGIPPAGTLGICPL
jgi:hypothetical protein